MICFRRSLKLILRSKLIFLRFNFFDERKENAFIEKQNGQNIKNEIES